MKKVFLLLVLAVCLTGTASASEVRFGFPSRTREVTSKEEVFQELTKIKQTFTAGDILQVNDFGYPDYRVYFSNKGAS